MRKLILILALPFAPACGTSEGEQNAVELANVAEQGGQNTITAVDETPLNSQAAAPAPKSFSTGPMRVTYDSSLLTPVPVKIQLPPDWQTTMEGVKLIGSDRAELIGKAECMYGQSGQASTCNAEQEAGLAFADLEDGWIQNLRQKVPAGQLKEITLGSVEGVSWQIGAEGEGAEYILLPVQEHTILIVRHFRNTGNPDEAALGSVLKDLKVSE